MPTYTLDEFCEHLKGDRATENIRAAVVRGLVRATIRAQQMMVTRVIPGQNPPPVDRGVFRAAWKMELLPNGARLYNDEKHAAFIEYGVRGSNVKIGRRMLDALAEWSMRRGLASSVAAERGIPIAHASRRLAWAIAKRMKREGIFNRYPGGGMQLLQGIVDIWLPDYVEAEVKAELEKVQL